MPDQEKYDKKKHGKKSADKKDKVVEESFHMLLSSI